MAHQLLKTALKTKRLITTCFIHNNKGFHYMKRLTTFIVGLGLTFSLAGQAGATVLTFTDQTAWQTALAGATFSF